METQIAYCSACDRQVRVIADAAAGAWPETGSPDPHHLVCLEYGKGCTGSFCPVFQLPVEQMRRNFETLTGRSDDREEA